LILSSCIENRKIEFTKTAVFIKFHTLPALCRRGSSELQSLQQSVVLASSNELQDLSNGIMNECKAEYLKAGNLCVCESEDCSGERGNRSLLGRLSRGNSRNKLCGEPLKKAMDESIDSCATHATNCGNRCNELLFEYKKKAREFFFVRALDPESAYLHRKYQTSCDQRMSDIYASFNESVRNSPYASSKRRWRELWVEDDLGQICEDQLRSLEESYSGIDTACERERVATRDDDEEEEEETKKNNNNSGSSFFVNKGYGAVGSSSTRGRQNNQQARAYSTRNNQMNGNKAVVGSSKTGNKIQKLGEIKNEKFAKPDAHLAGKDLEGEDLTGKDWEESKDEQEGYNPEGIEEFAKMDKGEPGAGKSVSFMSGSTGSSETTNNPYEGLKQGFKDLGCLPVNAVKEEDVIADKEIRDSLLQENS